MTQGSGMACDWKKDDNHKLKASMVYIVKLSQIQKKETKIKLYLLDIFYSVNK